MLVAWALDSFDESCVDCLDKRKHFVFAAVDFGFDDGVAVGAVERVFGDFCDDHGVAFLLVCIECITPR
jgi:hypothetical protein